MNILIVDDSLTTRKVIRRHLVHGGIDDAQIEEAGDGCAALELLAARQEPALVLCDVNMPKMDGAALLEKAAQLDVKHTFVVITSVAAFKKKLELLRLGAVKIIPKPFDPTTLADAIGPYLPGGAPRPDAPGVARPGLDGLPNGAALMTLGVAALQSTLEQMAFTEVMPVNGKPPQTQLFGASVRLDAGVGRWIIRLAADAASAGELSSRFTGQDPGEDQSLRLDAMQELANIVGGDLVRRATARFEDALPSLPTSGVLPPGAINHVSMRGMRLVPGGHHVWIDVEELA
jgi:CheY-like chemotaxis protein